MKSFSLPTKLYLHFIYASGVILFILNMLSMKMDHPWLLLVLCALASLALVLKVLGATDNSHYTFSFLVYGFTFVTLGLPSTLIVILVSNVVEWIWHKPKWFGQLFNIGSYFLAMQAAGLLYAWLNPSSSLTTWQTVLAILLSMAVFNFLNHLMVGMVLWLARGENLKTSKVLAFFPVMLDLALLTFGASLSFVWKENAAAILLFLLPVYLIYSTLRVPALERKVEQDSKTGLFNQEYFKKQLANELVRANRFDRPLSVIMADLDLLRNINNTYGHLAGDDVLIGISKALKGAVRDYDIVCRFGGEEFSILLPETSIIQAYEKAEQLRRIVESLEFTVSTSVTPIRVTMSFGIAQREGFSQTGDAITHNADLALYHSKLSGRNRSYAYAEDNYVAYAPGSGETHISQPSSVEAAPVKTEADLPAPRQAEPPLPVPESAPEPAPESSVEPQETKKPEREASKSKFSATIFIGLLFLVSLLGFAASLYWMPVLPATLKVIDWIGLGVICGLIVFSEVSSIDLYIRQTSVSTSAIPILVAYLIFGPVGVLVASLTVSIVLAIKYRSRFNRMVFNFSNHLLAGSLTVLLVSIFGKTFLELSSLYQFGISIVSAVVLFLVTTWMISIGVSLDQKQPALTLWKEQFSWLAYFYAGIGFIAYALIFGYRYDHIAGLVLMVIPIVLLRISQKQYVDRTRQVVSELREKNQMLEKKAQEITEVNEGLLVTLSEIIDLRDPYVLGHSKQVSHYSTWIAKSMGLNEKQVDLVRRSGLLHDIGKLGVPMEILSKPAKLNEEEYEVVKKHAALGGDLIKSSPSLSQLVPLIRHHHEYYNGEGYPDKISKNQIPIEARILAVSDAMEAMLSDRPYRKRLKTEKVIEELKKFSGTQFDPLVVKAAVKYLESRPMKKAS